MNRIGKFLASNDILHYGLIDSKMLNCGNSFLEKAYAIDTYSEFAERDISARLNPNEFMRKTESIFVALFPYELKKHSSHLGSFGVASFAEGLDYHKGNRVILQRVAELLGLDNTDDKEYDIHIDNGPMVDRLLAYLAGLGWYGKNCMLINPDLGSAFTIGSIFTTKRFVSEDYCNETLIDRCGDCNACLEACPGNAILDGYIIDCHCCISERLQSKRRIPYSMRERMDRCAYGCDVCQLVCPYNIGIIKEKADKRSIFDDLELGKRGFADKYGNMAFSWRGHSVFKRNLLILLGNMYAGSGDKKAFSAAADLAESHSDMVASHAWWAMARISPKSASRYLSEREKTETNPHRREEMERLIAHYCDENRKCL